MTQKNDNKNYKIESLKNQNNTLHCKDYGKIKKTIWMPINQKKKLQILKIPSDSTNIQLLIRVFNTKSKAATTKLYKKTDTCETSQSYPCQCLSTSSSNSHTHKKRWGGESSPEQLMVYLYNVTMQNNYRNSLTLM